jgi:hypothetical protein
MCCRLDKKPEFFPFFKILHYLFSVHVNRSSYCLDQCYTAIRPVFVPCSHDSDLFLEGYVDVSGICGIDRFKIDLDTVSDVAKTCNLINLG